MKRFSNIKCSSKLFQNLPANVESLRSTLFNEMINCQQRGLTESLLWITELLLSVGAPETTHNQFTELLLNFGLPETTHDKIEFISQHSPLFVDFSFAKALFDQKEFNRCAHHLKSMLGEHAVLDFLYFYARFKASLKYLHESEADWMNNESQKYVDNMVELREDIEEYIQEHNSEPYLLCLNGMILKKLDLKKEAKAVLITALNKHKYLWSAWYELSDLAEYNESGVPDNWMKKFFEVKSLKLLNNKDECDEAINSLRKNGFSEFDDLKIDLAIANEQKNNSILSLELFNEVYEKDPFRMDYFSTFSNILYLQENHKMLAELTQNCVKNDRYRPETCCVLGNFYSLRHQHDKAVLYFQRSLKIKPDQSSVWLLAAHEYVEMDNYNAGVQCYCKAIEYNPNSYRAWYGLGQLYEVFKNYKFALLCYQKGFELMSSDSRILIGLGNVFEELGRNEEAKTCFVRAHSIGDLEHIALIRLGKILEKMKEMKDAAAAFNLFIEEVQEEGFSALQNLSYANMFLANYHWKYSKNYERARHFALKCCEIPDSKMVGEDLLRKITTLDKNDLTDNDVISSPFELDLGFINKVPSDENLASNAMNLSLGDDATENDDIEVME